MKEVLKQFDLKRVPSLLEMGQYVLQYNVVQPFRHRPFLPRAMCIYVTYRCNLRCRMCGIWKQSERYETRELTLEELNQILSDPLFARLECININGGEPNLREDLAEMVDLFIGKFPRVNTISLNSNGLPPHKMVENVKNISTLCRKNKIRFSVIVSLHEAGEHHDAIVGIRGASVKVKEALEGIRGLNQGHPFYVGVNCVISDLNVHRLEEMIAWGQKNHFPVHFILGEMRERFHNLEMAEEIEIKGKDKAYLAHFFRHLAGKKNEYFQHALRYAHLADMIEFGKKRTLACHYALGGVILGSDGLLYYCKNSSAIGSCREKSAYEIYFDENNLRYREESLIKEKCPMCPPNTYNRMEIEKDLFRFLAFLLMG